jgi:hypothetical protein
LIKRFGVVFWLGFCWFDRTTILVVCGGGFVLGCFFGMGFVASLGCVPKSAGKCWQVKKSAGKC